MMLERLLSLPLVVVVAVMVVVEIVVVFFISSFDVMRSQLPLYWWKCDGCMCDSHSHEIQFVESREIGMRVLNFQFIHGSPIRSIYVWHVCECVSWSHHRILIFNFNPIVLDACKTFSTIFESSIHEPRCMSFTQSQSNTHTNTWKRTHRKIGSNEQFLEKSNTYSHYKQTFARWHNFYIQNDTHLESNINRTFDFSFFFLLGFIV